MFEIFIFSLGVALGCYAYGHGWRAQSPFYKEAK